MKLASTSALICTLLATPIFAGDITYPWSSASFHVSTNTGAASVHLEGEKELTKVLLTTGGVAIEVPEEELEGLDLPQLETAQAFFGEDWYGEYVEGDKPTPHTIIELYYGKRSSLGGFTAVRFLFHSGKYQARIKHVRDSETRWKEIYKPVGEEAYEAGVIIRPNPNRPESDPDPSESTEEE